MSADTSYGMFRCACGKMAYQSKSSAKAAKQRLHPADRAVRIYACDLPLNRVWHLGHQTTDRQFYREKRAEAQH